MIESHTNPLQKKRFKVSNGGRWNWSGFCKTQYANDPNCGGIENFLRCHLLIIEMLDRAKEIGFDVSVRDESEYWDNRDVKALIQEIGEWDRQVAGFVGLINDAIGKKSQSPISQYPNFEHLEAEANITENQKQIAILISHTAKNC